MTYTVQALDDRALTCRVTATAKSGRYRIVTDYLTDPRPADASCCTVALRGAAGPARATTSSTSASTRRSTATAAAAAGNGGADSGTSSTVDGHTCSSARTRSPRPTPPTATTRSPSSARSTPRARSSQVSNGFAGAASDGLKQLDASRRADRDVREPRTATSSRPRRSTSAATARSRSRSASAPTAAEAVAHRPAHRCDADSGDLDATTRAAGTATTPSSSSRGARSGVSRAHLGRDLLDQYYLSANYVKAAEDKTFPGAVAAALASPWGQAISRRRPDATPTSAPTARCSPATCTRRGPALFLAGDRRHGDGDDALPVRAPAAAGRLDAAQQPHQRQAAPDSFNTQLDECAYPLVMALAVGLTERALLRGPHQAGRELRRQPRAVVRARALGGAGRLLAVDDLRRDRRPDRRRRIADLQRRPRVGARCGAASPTSSSATSRRGR